MTLSFSESPAPINADSVQAYVKWLKQQTNEKVWLPARINPDGTIDNVTQAHVRIMGAKKGESNFKKSQKPTKHGYKKGCDLGTYVMNLHPEYEIVKTNEIDIDAKVLRYGKTVKRRYLTPQDRIFAQAAERAAEILTNSRPDIFLNKGNGRGNAQAQTNSAACQKSTKAESTRNSVI